MSDATMPEGGASTGEKVPLEAPRDHFGNTREGDRDRYPEGSPAREGQTTRPSGQGGATPHDGVSYQDQFVPNPEPSESAKAKGEENDRIATGDTNPVNLANERLANLTGTEPEQP